MRTICIFIRNHSPLLRSRGLAALLMIALLASLEAGSGLVVARPQPRSGVVPQANPIPLLAGMVQAVNAGAGDQTDPRVDCNLVTYVDAPPGAFRVRYYDFSSGTDFATPGNGVDTQPAIAGKLIAFTEGDPTGSHIVLFDTATQFRTDLAGPAGSKAALGGNLVAFEDRSFFVAPNMSEISVYDQDTGVTTRLTNDQLFDKSVDVSPTGNVLVWEKCHTDGTACDIYSAVQTAPDVFTVSALVSSPGEERDPHTNGQFVVYTSDRSGLIHVYFQPIGGGSETQIILSGNQRNPKISGNLIAFESEVGTEYHIFVYDITSGSLYQATNTPGTEFLGGITVCNGIARIVYGTSSADWDVYAFTFQIPNAALSQINNLIALVRSFGLAPRIQSSLIAPLQAALNAIAVSDNATACSSMTTFINLVQAQGKKLTPAQASQLISGANQIKATLGCP